MNENQFLSIKPKWMFVKPFKPASLPADIGFVSKNGRAGKLGSSTKIILDLQQSIVLLNTLRSRQSPGLDLTDVEADDPVSNESMPRATRWGEMTSFGVQSYRTGTHLTYKQQRGRLAKMPTCLAVIPYQFRTNQRLA
jgi:hypothetical protein